LRQLINCPQQAAGYRQISMISLEVVTPSVFIGVQLEFL